MRIGQFNPPGGFEKSNSDPSGQADESNHFVGESA
jgi:hypothetical protein